MWGMQELFQIAQDLGLRLPVFDDFLDSLNNQVRPTHNKYTPPKKTNERLAWG
jgi:hypothetical protein